MLWEGSGRAEAWRSGLGSFAKSESSLQVQAKLISEGRAPLGWSFSSPCPHPSEL